MKILLAHARSNENGQIFGGQPGDQTGQEVCVQEFFEYSWNWIFRPKRAEVAEQMAKGGETICANPNVGYDHPDRYSMYLQAKALKYDFERISKPCHTDCSQMTATLINSCGIAISPYIFTGNMADYIDKTGEFTRIKYSNKSQLRRGDILLTIDRGHVVIITQGADADPSTPSSAPQYSAEVYGKELVDVHISPNAKARTIKAWPQLAVGNWVDVCDEIGDWCYIRIAGQYYGWLERAYLLRKTPYGKAVIQTSLHLRTNPGSKFQSLAVMPKGAKVDICDAKPTADTGVMWDYIIYKGMYGFCSSRKEYIKEV